METNKDQYYWMSFELILDKSKNEIMTIEDVTTEHPFIYITKLRNKNSNYRGLLNWKIISEKDYLLFNDILFNIGKPEYNS
jgi:hypothetical protein